VVGLVIWVRDVADDAKIIALDAASGSLKWETRRDSTVSWCTPVVWDTPSGQQVVSAGHGRMIGYDLASGREIWSVAGMPSGCCTSPVSAADCLLFAGWSPGGSDDSEFQMPKYDDLLKDLDEDKNGVLSQAEGEKSFGGFFENQDADKDGQVTREEYDLIVKFMAEGKNSALAVKPGGAGDVSDSHVLWRKTKGLPYVASAILYGGQYVMVKDGGIITAYDVKTGEEIYTQRAAAAGPYYASPVAANGHIYFTSLEDGTVTVLKAGADKADVVAQNEPLGERVAATPAIADDTIYIRSEKHLYAFEARD
jgi:outer membrane protein assembly factor BamB